MVQFLLSRGADPNANLSGHINSTLEVAAITSSIPVLDALLDAGAALRGHSALCNAAEYGRLDVVGHLLDRGAAIDEVPDHKGISEFDREQGVKNALCMAASNGQVEVVKLLLERGADVKVMDSKGKSAIEVAAEGKHFGCVEILRIHIEGPPELQI